MAIYKHTLETAKQKCIDTHGDLYDYSDMIYKDSKTPFKVKCKQHGIFEATLANHAGVLKRGCPKCSLRACDYTRSSKDEFIEKAKARHGDKFDYSLVDYKNVGTKVKIICPVHGVFEQIPSNHYKYDCAECSRETKNNNLKDDKLIFIKKAKEKHDDKYDYSLANYINSQTKVKINCSEHGIFEMTPAKHIYGQGCKECGKKNYKTKYTIENLKELLKNLKTDFDYSLINLQQTDLKQKVEIICPKHGMFKQSLSYHIKHKSCPFCSKEKAISTLKAKALEQKYTTEIFIKKANKVHNNKYIYNDTLYIHSKQTVDIICSKHGSFQQLANSHLQGSGCLRCAIEYRMSLENYSTYLRDSFIKTPKEKAIFYILECWNDIEKFYKIGITTRSVKERYKRIKDMPYNYKILTEIVNTPTYVWDLEFELKQKLKSQYNPTIHFSGSIKECYSDIDEILTALN